MQERILIAPNGTELLRTLARNGVSTLGLRVMLPAELALFALMRSGQPLEQRITAADEETALICRFLPEIPYLAGASYRDAQNLADALRTLRLQITSADERGAVADGLAGSTFTEKNAALLDVYDRYMLAMQHENAVDAVGLVRLAAEHADPLTAEITVLKEYPVTPLELALISRLSGGAYQRRSLPALFQAAEKPLIMPQITEAYGAANEAEAVFGAVFAQHLPLDQCTVAVTDAAVYAPLLFELACRYEIPVTFGCGLPITLSWPASVLRDYQSWLTGGHCGIDALHALLYSAAFDREQFCADFGIEKKALHSFIRTAGSMRLSADRSVNQKRIADFRDSAERDEALIAQLTAVFVDFGMDCAGLIRKYAKTRKNAFAAADSAARQKISDTLEKFTAMTGKPAETVIPELLGRRICAENSREGALHVTTVSGAFTALRKNLFVMGLSAELFPGTPAENYLLLDHELSAFGEQAPTSFNRIKQTQTALTDLLHTAAALDVRTALSYCGYDTAELRENNASSVLYRLYLETGGTDEDAFRRAVRQVGYFSQHTAGMTEIGCAYLHGETVAGTAPAPEETADAAGLITALSPSTIEHFLKCPKLFCYETVMGLSIPEPDDVFQVIDPRTLGTLVHEAMEYCCGRQAAHEDFMANAEQVFARFMTERPPMNPQDAEVAHSRFRKAAENGFYAVAGMQIDAAEEELHTEYECGITVNGRPDAIARLADGTLRILDYKTGAKLERTENDVVSCIQVMMYADMLHRAGIEVTGGDYCFLTLNRKISCEYTPEHAAFITQLTSDIADAMRKNEYPANANKNNCQYCKYRAICAEGSAVKC